MSKARSKKQDSLYDTTDSYKVKRDHKKDIVHFDDLIVGDLIKIKNGMTIPCDGFLVNGSEVLVDESNMTGDGSVVKKEVIETCEEMHHDKLKDDNSSNFGNTIRSRNELPSPILLSGTQIRGGKGHFMVVTVGKNPCLGQTLVSKNANAWKTPLQLKLDLFLNDIRKCATLIAGVIVL